MSRIEELERRVRQDPASITFGALAEEYRRAGRLEEAVAACRNGLDRHPSYVSARVTLGRALQQLGRAADARGEFEYVLSIAPDNLAAIRGLAEMHSLDGSEPPPPPLPAVIAAPAPVPVVVAAPPAPAGVPQEPAHAAPALQADPITRELEAAGSDTDIAPAFGGEEPDFAALDASIAAAGTTDAPTSDEGGGAPEAQRAAQIERLEIWLVRLDELRRDGPRRA